MGIPDEESWFRRSYVPTGRVTGWRRRVLLVVLVAILVLMALGLVVGVVARLI